MCDLLSGRVQAEGIELLPINLPVEELFLRFTKLALVQTVNEKRVNSSI